jgi:hypothetical protein
LKSAIFAVTNVAGRLASVLAPVVVEYFNNPAITVAVVSFGAVFTTKLLEEHNDNRVTKS